MFSQGDVMFMLQYLLVGVCISFLLEAIIRWSQQEVSNLERIQMIIGWPLMTLIFAYNFIKGFFNND